MNSQVVAHYRILTQLGAGGMGEVYLAEDTKLYRKVAIKFLSAKTVNDDRAQKRLIREAQAAAKLDHPNICSIYEVGEEAGRTFIVMQHVEGETLARLIQEDPPELLRSLDIAVQIADALAEAHSLGIIHRDIKPQNIMVTKRGQVRVMDFGLAKIIRERQLTGSEAETQSLLTEPGLIVGTLPYMSPEQVRGEGLDARSDIFSFGAVLYELVTGTLPFAAASAAATISTILTNEPPPLARFSRNVPPELERIASKALRKDREQRYQTARDLLIDLKCLNEQLKFEAKLGASTPARLTGESEAVTHSKQARVETAPQPTRTSAEASAPSTKANLIAVARNRKLSFSAVALALAAVIAIGIYVLPGRGKTIDSLAVLPFTNVSGDPNTEYLSDGITESLINNLSQLPNLTVMSRSSVFHYKGQDADAQMAGRALKVQAVLTGRMVQHGDTLSISVEFVDVRDNSHLWGDQYNRRLSDILAVQEEIARQISEKLRLRLSGEDKQRLAKHYTDDTEAYQLYLKGRYYWNKRSAEGNTRAIKFYQQAIDIDANYALAWAGLADAYYFQSQLSGEPKEVAYPRGKAAAEKALELDDTLAEAHTSLTNSLEIERNWSGMEREFKRAIELNPNYPVAHLWYSQYLQWMGRLDEGKVEIQRALQLDPLSLPINANVGHRLYLERQYDQAIEQFRKTLEMDPSFRLVHVWLFSAYVQNGNYEQATLEEARVLAGTNAAEEARIAAALRNAYAASGERGFWEKVIALPMPAFDSSFWKAEGYVHLGNKDQAFALYQKAADEVHPGLEWIKVDPLFDGLRSDPRYQDLLLRMRLAP